MSAGELRSCLGRLLRSLEQGGTPILVERNHRPVAVLISIDDFDQRSGESTGRSRQRAARRIEQLRFGTPAGQTSLDLLRSLRRGF